MTTSGPIPAGPKIRRLFVSYSHRDREVAARVTQLLRVTGAPVFQDEDCIPPGKLWRLVLEEEIRAAACVLVFWSAAAAASEEVRKEYLVAIGLGKDVAPVLLDDTALPPELAAYQWIDFRGFVTIHEGSTLHFGPAPPSPTEGLYRTRQSPYDWALLCGFAGGLLAGLIALILGEHRGGWGGWPWVLVGALMFAVIGARAVVKANRREDERMLELIVRRVIADGRVGDMQEKSGRPGG